MSSIDGSEFAAGAQSAPAHAATRAHWRAGLLFAGLASCYVAGVSARPLVAPDEFRYAEVPREMLASSDWVVPRLDGVVYFEKPALGYWLTALSIRAFGTGAAAVRLPFAISTLLSGAILFALVRRFGSGARTAWPAALGFLTCIEVAAIGTTAVLDALFALGVTATLAALFAAIEQRPGAARQAWLAASGAACGAAFLTKGFLAFAIPISVAVPYLVWSRRSRDLLRLAWTPLGAALAVAAPWSLAIARAEPDFWHQFIVNEHLRRFAGEAPQHAAPFWYFAPVLAGGALPWTTLLAPALRRFARATLPLSRFCVCWLVAPMLLLSAASGKLMTYALPCFPPLFALIAEGAAAQPRARLARHLAGIAAALAALGVAAAVALIAPPPALAASFDADESWRRGLGAIGALAAAAIATCAIRRADPAPLAAAIAAAFSLGIATAALAFPTGEVSRIPERWLARDVDPVPADAIVVADRSLVHAVCWHLRRDDVRVLWSPGELRYGLEHSEQAHWIDYEQLEALIRDRTRTRPVVVIGRTGRSFLPRAPSPDRSETGRAAFFGVYEPVPGAHSASRAGADEDRVILVARGAGRAINDRDPPRSRARLEQFMDDDRLPFSRPLLGDEEIGEAVAVLRSGWLTSGPRVQRFEREFARYIGSPHAAAVSSCTAALHTALIAHGIGPGDEVVTTAMTWPATANCIELVGARPVFADVDPGTLQLTRATVEAAITPRTRAILPVHFAGQACDLDGFSEVADRHGMVVIEDAAHAAGTEYRGRRIGAGPNTACFSFHPAKNLTTAEGGMVTTPVARIAERVRRLRFHGIDRDAAARHSGRAPTRYETVEPGFKYNLTDLQAAIGIHQLARLDGFIERRAKLAALYREALRDCPEVAPLVLDPATTRHAWHLFVVLLDLERLRCDREEFAARLDARGIATGLHFTAVHLHRYYRKRYGHAAGDLPHSEYAEARVLSLPLFPEMEEADVARVCGAIGAVAGEVAG